MGPSPYLRPPRILSVSVMGVLELKNINLFIELLFHTQRTVSRLQVL